MTKLKNPNLFIFYTLMFVFGAVVMSQGHLPPFWEITRIWVINLSVLLFVFISVSLLAYANKTTGEKHNWARDSIAIRFVRDEFLTFSYSSEEHEKWRTLLWIGLCGLSPLTYTGDYLNVGIFAYGMAAYHTALSTLNKSYAQFIITVKKKNGIKD